MDNKIPKVIHYVWVGGKPKPESALKCIESWKKYCPDYEIKEWNETNFDINSVPFVKEAIECKKYAFASDYIRMYALYNEGGLYMDTDAEVVKPLDEFLVHRAFFGFENDIGISTPLIGCEKNHPIYKDILDYYKGRHFLREDGSMDTTPNIQIISAIARLKYGLVLNNTFQVLRDGLVVYPKDWFCPKNILSGRIECTENTHVIHHFEGTWLSQIQKSNVKFMKFLSRCMPKKMFYKMTTHYDRKAYEKFYKKFCEDYLKKDK